MEQPLLVAGKYRILAEIGRGGMGVVYRAEDTTLRRPVALKFLSENLAGDPAARARFLREAQAAAALDNPHVCTVYQAGEHEGRAFIAMALVEGHSLKQRLAQGPLALDEVLAFSREIAEGLAEAHGRRIAHRDIKPANIMLAGGRQAKITDFGLARIEGSGDTTQTGGIVGTLAYMSPEQAQGLPTDQRTDIWSLGCVIYEMLAGRAPFSPSPAQADLHALVHSDPRPVTVVRPDAPPRLTAIVGRCLEKDHRRRYPDARSLLDDLEAVRLEAAAPALAAPARAAVPSIAVLPFTDMSQEKNQAFFCEGIAEELIHALARLQGLRVLYLKGLYFLARPRPDLLQTALRFFREALVRDPGFAKAYAGIATAYAMLGNFNFAPPTEAWPKAKAAVEKALALDYRLPEALDIAASVAFWYEWNWAAAEACFNRILALHPGDAFTHGNYAWFLLSRRRDDESLREIERALDLDPLMPLFYGWSVGLHCAVGRFDEALRDFARGRRSIRPSACPTSTPG